MVVRSCVHCGTTYRHDGRGCHQCEYINSIEQRREQRRLLRARVKTASRAPDKVRSEWPKSFVDAVPTRTSNWLSSAGHLNDICAAWPRLRQRLRKYGISATHWAELVVASGSRCMICAEPHAPLTLVIDHDHVSGAVRGLLCGRCNTGIGMLRIDGPEGVKRAKAVRRYLEAPRIAGRSDSWIS